MTHHFTKSISVAIALVISSTSLCYATFSLHHDKPKQHVSIPKHKKPIKHDIISLLPEYCPPTTPTVPHNPPSVPHNPPTTPPTSVSEPFSLLAIVTAMSAFLYRRRQK